MYLSRGDPGHCPRRRGRNPNMALIVFSALCVVMYDGSVAGAFVLGGRLLLYARFVPLVLYAVVATHEWPTRQRTETSDAAMFPGQYLLLTSVLLGVVPAEVLLTGMIDSRPFTSFVLMSIGAVFFVFCLRMTRVTSDNVNHNSALFSAIVILLSSVALYIHIFLPHRHW